MRQLLVIACALACWTLWLVAAPLAPPLPRHGARSAHPLPVMAVSAIGAVALLPARPTLGREALARRLDEQLPGQLYAQASHCYQGGLPADQRLDLSYRVHVAEGQLSITEAGVTSGALGDGALQRCIVDRVLAFEEHDPQLPDLDESGELFLRVGGFKPFLAQVAEDGDQPRL